MTALVGLAAIVAGVLMILKVTGNLRTSAPTTMAPARADQAPAWFGDLVQSNQAAGIPVRTATYTSPGGAFGTVGFALTDVTPEQPGQFERDVFAELSGQLRYNDEPGQ